MQTREPLEACRFLSHGLCKPPQHRAHQPVELHNFRAEEAIKKVKEIRGRRIRRKKQLDTLKEYESFLQIKDS